MLILGTSVGVQRLKFQASTVGGVGSFLVGELRPPHVVWWAKKKKKNVHSTTFIEHYPLLPSECILFLWFCLYLAQGLADNWYPDSGWLN